MQAEMRIGCAVPAVAVANPVENARQICDYMTQAAQAGCELLVFPEFALSGATCGDLLCQRLLLEKVEESLQKIGSYSARFAKMTVVLGLPVVAAGKVRSCAAAIRGGIQLGQDEALDFTLEDGTTVTAIAGAMQMLPAADVVVHLCAELALAGSRDQRRQRALEGSQKGVYVYCGAGQNESVTDGVYAGHSIIARNGALLGENEQIVDGGYLLTAQINAPALPVNIRQRNENSRMPFLTGYEDEIFTIQASGLARRLKLLNAKAVVGVSGGLDSTLALLVAAEAMHRLGRSATDVHAVTMPGFGTTDRTYQNAQTLMQLLGVTVKEIPIRDAVTLHFADIGHDPKLHDLTYENAQARERTQILMDYAGKVGGIVIGTGDLSELALGWCTYNGDHMSMYSVNASLPKTLLPDVIRQAAKLSRYAKAEAVLQDVIDTPISPELLPPDAGGNIAQQTEDLVGPYLLHDFFLYHTLESGCPPEKLYCLACRIFAGEFAPDTVKKWLKVFYRRFFTQQFKRNCTPEGVKAMPLSLNPRGDWRMPGDASAALWLAEVEKL